VNVINTAASARCLRTSDGPKPFQRLSDGEKTFKRVSRGDRILHRAEASVLMTPRVRLSDTHEWLARSGAPGGRALPLLLALPLLIAACRPDMANQPKAKPLSQSDFFSNQANARPIPPHTIEQGNARENAAFYTGLTNGTYVTQLPVALTPELLARGRERFDIMCAECHDRTGSGNGMVVLRGFPQPPSYHVPRLRNAPIGHFFDVITNGYGVMYSYATRVEPEDRWAVAAYIRALQLSHNVKASELSPDERQKLENEK
jgi:mono/diheme cytochrome c family protein